MARNAAILPAPVPEALVLLLDQHGTPLQPCVAVGAPVYMGQVIARPVERLQPEWGASLHSPVSGRVRAIELQASPRGDGQTWAMIIDNDHLDRPDPSLQALPDWLALTPLALCEHLARGGVVGLGGAVFSTATKLAAHRQQAIDHLLINGVECEPFICCDDRLMRERAGQILQGVQILLHAAQAQHCRIAIEADKPEALAAMQAAALALDDARIGIDVIPPFYPSGDEGQLIAQLLHREIPRHGLPADVGVVVHNVATAYACAQWLLQARPLISRIVTVTGPGIPRPANLEVRIGTRIRDLLAVCGHDQFRTTDTLIMGGAMMGRTLGSDQLPIVKASNCLIVAQYAALKPPGVELPCIRCGECAEACPVFLLPQQLLFYARSGNPTALRELGVQDCIECGCCDYVCPSHIPLAARFHTAKRVVE